MINIIVLNENDAILNRVAIRVEMTASVIQIVEIII